MYTTKATDKWQSKPDGYISIGDPYVKDKSEKMATEKRVDGKQFGTGTVEYFSKFSYPTGKDVYSDTTGTI